MDNALHRHDISDRAWEIIAPHLPGKKGDWGRVAKDNRQFVNAVMWILHTGSSWRSLPPELGKWSSIHRRFCRWRDKKVWERVLAVVIDEPDFEWLMIDVPAQAHSRVRRTRSGKKAIGQAKEGATSRFIWPWMRMVCRSESLSLQIPWRILRLLQHRQRTSKA